MTIYVLALVIGVVAGLRTLTAPAAISWAAYLGWLQLSDTWLAFLGYAWTPWIFTILGLVELVADQCHRHLAAPCLSNSARAWYWAPCRGRRFVRPADHRSSARSSLLSALSSAHSADEPHPAAIIEDVAAIGIAVMTVLVLR